MWSCRLLAFLTFGLQIFDLFDFWFPRHLSSWLLAFWTLGLLDIWSFGHLIFWTFGLLDIWSFGHLSFFDFWSLSILPTEGKLHTASYNWQTTTGKIFMGKTLAGITRLQSTSWATQLTDQKSKRPNVQKIKCPKDQMSKRSNVQKSKCPKGQKSWDQKSEEQRSKSPSVRKAKGQKGQMSWSSFVPKTKCPKVQVSKSSNVNETTCLETTCPETTSLSAWITYLRWETPKYFLMMCASSRCQKWVPFCSCRTN